MVGDLNTMRERLGILNGIKVLGFHYIHMLISRLLQRYNSSVFLERFVREGANGRKEAIFPNLPRLPKLPIGLDGRQILLLF